MRQKFEAVAVGNSLGGWVIDPTLTAPVLEALAAELIDGVPDEVGGLWPDPTEVNLGVALYDRAKLLRTDPDPDGIEAAWREAGGFNPPSPEG